MKTYFHSHQSDVEEQIDDLMDMHCFDRMHKKDAFLWTDDRAHHDEITHRLGWLKGPEHYLQNTGEMKALAEQVKGEKYVYAVLLGMGGSSLAPEVLQTIFGKKAGYLELLVLDSTDARSIRDVEQKIGTQKTLFIVASKSGTTVESASLYQYFFAKVAAQEGESAGKHFIAITDPGMSLEAEAKAKKFRKTFLNDPNVGGRFSALTYFGMVPAALIGIDVDAFLLKAKHRANACAPGKESDRNPAVVLGAAMAVFASEGRDKMTLVTSPAWESFGDWVEQLVAESTGKEGKGVVPVVREQLAEPSLYGHDRFFVVLSDSDKLTPQLEALSKAGHPVLVLTVKDALDLAEQFYDWEIATSIAGAILKIDPFDQPNVQEAKTKAKSILSAGGAKTDGALTPEQAITQLMKSIKTNNHVNLLAFIPGRASNLSHLRALGESIRKKTQCPVNVGIGPRYLHSTGQLHKGGKNDGVFLVLISPAAANEDLAIPGEKYSFQNLVLAQAIGDYEALKAKGRRAFLCQMPDLSDKTFENLRNLINKS